MLWWAHIQTGPLKLKRPKRKKEKEKSPLSSLSVFSTSGECTRDVCEERDYNFGNYRSLRCLFIYFLRFCLIVKEGKDK